MTGHRVLTPAAPAPDFDDPRRRNRHPRSRARPEWHSVRRQRSTQSKHTRHEHSSNAHFNPPHTKAPAPTGERVNGEVLSLALTPISLYEFVEPNSTNS